MCLIIPIRFSQNVLHGEVVPLLALKVYGGVAPFILNLGPDRFSRSDSAPDTHWLGG